MSKPADPRKIAIARNLVKFREAAKLTQEAASRLAEVPIDNLRRYEQGSSTPKMLALDSLARLYGHNIADFMMDDPPPPRLAERKPFYLRTIPGMDLNDEVVKQMEEAAAAVLREWQEIQAKKRKRK